MAQSPALRAANAELSTKPVAALIAFKFPVPPATVLKKLKELGVVDMLHACTYVPDRPQPNWVVAALVALLDEVADAVAVGERE